jgi:hypothetical protein
MRSGVFFAAMLAASSVSAEEPPSPFHRPTARTRLGDRRLCEGPARTARAVDSSYQAQKASQ